MPQVTVPVADAPLVLDKLPGAEQEAIAVANRFILSFLPSRQQGLVIAHPNNCQMYTCPPYPNLTTAITA